VGKSSSFPKQVDGQSFESYLLFILIEDGSVLRRDSTDGLVGLTRPMGQKEADETGDIQSEAGLLGLNEKMKIRK
jgi:hypothetical protein